MSQGRFKYFNAPYNIKTRSIPIEERSEYFEVKKHSKMSSIDIEASSLKPIPTADPIDNLVKDNNNSLQEKSEYVKSNNWFNFKANDGYTSLKQGEKVKVGDTEIRVTDPYGIRSFKGREGRHSTGIDIVTDTGKAISLNDGVIEDVKIHKTTKVIKPTEGSAAGVYVIVRNSDGSRTQYMHLDPMTKDDMKKLRGKKLKRGDNIWSYKTGSGSITGPHVKVRHYGNTSRYNIDPSQLIRGENYAFIPDKMGNNILTLRKGGVIISTLNLVDNSKLVSRKK